TNPPKTIGEAIGRINQALGSGPAVRFHEGVLEIDLSQTFSRTADLDLGFNLDDHLNAGLLKQFVDVNAAAPRTLSSAGTASLGLVIDLHDPSAPVFSIKDTSGLTVTTLVNAPDIGLAASVGPLGVFVRDGHVRLDNGTPGQAATWAVSLAAGAGG